MQWGSRCVAPLILNFRTGQRRVVSFIARPLYCRRRSLQPNWIGGCEGARTRLKTLEERTVSSSCWKWNYGVSIVHRIAYRKCFIAVGRIRPEHGVMQRFCCWWEDSVWTRCHPEFLLQVQGAGSLPGESSCDVSYHLFPQRGLVGTPQDCALGAGQVPAPPAQGDHSRGRFLRYG
jgi:hypothetical protein